jgi:hypothetical protein
MVNRLGTSNIQESRLGVTGRLQRSEEVYVANDLVGTGGTSVGSGVSGEKSHQGPPI